MASQTYEEDMIDLVDLFYYLLQRWRSFLLAVVLGLVCGALALVLKNSAFRYQPEEADLLKMEQIYQYQQLYENQLKYNEESFTTQQEPEVGYVSGELRYSIRAEENVAEFSKLLDITDSNGYIEALQKQLGWDGENRPIVSYSFSVDKSIALDKTGVANQGSAYGVATYTVQFVEKEDCEVLLEYIETWIESQNVLYQEQYGPYTIERVSRVIWDAGEAGAISAKSDAVNAVVGMQKTLDEYLGELSDEERQYYEEHYLGKEVESGLGSLMKWPAIAVVIVCVLWGIYWVVAYLASGTVRQIDTLTEQYKLPLVGRIENTSGKREKGLDGAIRRWENGRKPAACTVQYLSSALALLPGRDIVLCQTSGDADSSALVEELKRQSAKPVYSGALHTDAQTLQAGKEAGGIFLLVTLEKTRLEELKAELRACKLHGLQVLGVVVLG